MPASDGLLPPVAPLPSDAVLLHIGVHKTGTTALQAALADARPDLVECGVQYPGAASAHHSAALSAIGKPWGWRGRGAKVRDIAHFESVVADARGWSGRTIISSEHFCEADDAVAERIVQAFGRERLHVVVTVRSLPKLLPSSWQQYLKYGLTWTYEDWLKNILDDAVEAKVSPSFWKRNDFGALAQRWGNLVGPDRVTFLVLEGVGRSAIFTAFAQMLALPDGIFDGRMELTGNRSMTAQETELLRRVNEDLRFSLDWRDYEKLVRYGVARTLVEQREPAPDEPGVSTPDWALDEAVRRASADIAVIRGTGVTVVGDLESLAARGPSGPLVTDADLARVPMDVAVHALSAAVMAASIQPKEKPLRAQTRELAGRWKRAAASRFGRKA